MFFQTSMIMFHLNLQGCICFHGWLIFCTYVNPENIGSLNLLLVYRWEIISDIRNIKHQTTRIDIRFSIRIAMRDFAHGFLFICHVRVVRVSNPFLPWLPGCQFGCSCSTYAFLSLLPLGEPGEGWLGVRRVEPVRKDKHIIYSGIIIKITTIFT